MKCAAKGHSLIFFRCGTEQHARAQGKYENTDRSSKLTASAYSRKWKHRKVLKCKGQKNPKTLSQTSKKASTLLCEERVVGGGLGVVRAHWRQLWWRWRTRWTRQLGERAACPLGALARKRQACCSSSWGCALADAWSSLLAQTADRETPPHRSCHRDKANSMSLWTSRRWKRIDGQTPLWNHNQRCYYYYYS